MNRRDIKSTGTSDNARRRTSDGASYRRHSDATIQKKNQRSTSTRGLDNLEFENPAAATAEAIAALSPKQRVQTASRLGWPTRLSSRMARNRLPHKRLTVGIFTLEAAELELQNLNSKKSSTARRQGECKVKRSVSALSAWSTFAPDTCAPHSRLLKNRI